MQMHMQLDMHMDMHVDMQMDRHMHMHAHVYMFMHMHMHMWERYVRYSSKLWDALSTHVRWVGAGSLHGSLYSLVLQQGWADCL